MAYQVKRKQRFEETLELCDENGCVKHAIIVRLDADDMIAKINRKYTELTRTLAETTELKRKMENNEAAEECLERLGMAVVNLFEAVFGEEDTEKIVQFYDNRYLEMCNEIVPFITGVVIPRCNEIRAENRRALLQSYDKRHHPKMFKGQKRWHS